MADQITAQCDLCCDTVGPHCPDKLCRVCDECGAEPGKLCEPFCTAPYSNGGPLEHSEL